MDLGGAHFGNSLPRLDTDQSKPERSPEQGPGDGLPRDIESVPSSGLNVTEDQCESHGIPEVQKGQNGLLVGLDSDANMGANLGPQKGHSVRAPVKMAECPLPGSWWPEEPEGELPIMNWEALEDHIAGLQLREMEKQAREGARVRPVEPPPSPTGRRKTDGAQRLVSWHRADSTAWKVMGNTISCESRFHSRMNLQLCFINDSDSESDTEEASDTPADITPQPVAGEVPPAERALISRRKELEREAKRSLALVKRQLDLERQQQRERATSDTPCGALGSGRPLDPNNLWDMTLLQLQNLQTSVFSQIHCLNTQLMELLEVRDDLNMEQDAMLVEIGDLTH